jgi:hypothetical protein
MTRKSLIPAAILVAGALSSAAVVAAAPAAPGPPTGDPEGIALVQKVNRYYSSPARLGVEMRMGVPGVVMNLRFVLVRGRVQAATATAAIGSDRIKAVVTRAAEFEWIGGKRCWRRNAAGGISSSEPMIVLRGSRVFAPEPIGSLVRLELRERNVDTGKLEPTVYKVDPRTGRITTAIMEDWVFTVSTLPKPPAIPSLKPLC